MPTITFEFPVKEIYLNEDDFDGYETESFEYEYDSEVLYEVLVKLFSKQFDISTKDSEHIISELDLFDVLEDYYKEELEETLKEVLYDDAYELYQDWSSREDNSY
jgi:hypothetical protein